MARMAWLLSLAWLLGCAPSDTHDLGALRLALTSRAGGETYRLDGARLRLEGPEAKDLSTRGEDELSVDLVPGVYTLRLLEGWSLVRVDGTMDAKVEARLVSENPSAVEVRAGSTTEAVLRFEIGGAGFSGERGRLQVGVSVDQGTGSAPPCAGELQITEIDYEQAGSDEHELVEIANVGACDASLTGITLELVNGGDGKVYGRYALQDAEKQLAPRARLVVGDPMVLSTLAPGTLQLAMNGTGLQNGPDGVRLVDAMGRVLDAVAYEGAVPSAGEGEPVGADEGEGAWARCPDGFDSDDNGADFALVAPSPGAPNACE